MEEQSLQVRAQNALTSLSLNTLTKKDIQENANLIKKAIAEGLVDSVDMYIYGKKLEAQAKKVIEAVQEYASGDLNIGKNEKYDRFGTSVTTRDAGKYDYSTSKDPEWDKLDAQIKSLAEQKKERENFLKSLTKSMTVVDEESGDINTVYPPAKSSTLSIVVSIK